MVWRYWARYMHTYVPFAGQQELGAFVPGAGTGDSELVRKELLIFLWPSSVSYCYLGPGLLLLAF